MPPVRNDKSFLPRVRHVEELDDGALPLDNDIDQLLVDVFRVLRRLQHETLLANLLELRLVLARVGIGKVALIDKVAAQLLFLTARKRAGRAKGLDAVAVAALRLVQVFPVDSLLVARAVDYRYAGLAGVDVDGVVGCFLV